METINNMATAAAKAVWGESNQTQEPVSGAKGDTSKGEPFDKGNLDEPQTTSSTAGTTGATDNSTATGTTEFKSDAQFAKSTGTAAESDNVPDNKQTELKAKDTPSDTSKGQNDTRSPEDPQTNPKNQPSDVDNTGDGPNKAQELDGPGPKPINEVAKEHGGDAGNSNTNVSSSGGDKKSDETDDPNDPHAKSTGDGTGEKYVKSSGLAADGGDFDATKPGAGKEADRLLEEKGIHVAKDTKKDESSTSLDTKGSGSGEKEKKSLKDKIKDKLHRH